MMHKKALLFNDINTSKLILNTKQPRKQKELGRMVKGFDSKVWEENAEKIVYKGNYAKFTQNKNLLRVCNYSAKSGKKFCIFMAN
jgi:ribA/ribD-fused uncharacterized protein